MEKLLFSLLLFFFACSATGTTCSTPIMNSNILVNGEKLYLAESGGYKGDVRVISNTSIMIQHGPRFYLTEKCEKKFSPFMFKKFSVLGGWFSFKVDLSKVGCGCNAAVYFVKMPAYNSSTLPTNTTCGDYYCDANEVCGQFCPEMDLMEANRRAISITPHSCDKPVGKYYSKCDGIGCSRKSHDLNPKAFGPGDNYIINTLYPFKMNFSFIQSKEGQLREIKSVLTGYNGEQFTVTHTDPTCPMSTRIADMTNDFKEGMVLAVSSWGGDGETMKWLDVPPCDPTEACNNGPFLLSEIEHGKFSNL